MDKNEVHLDLNKRKAIGFSLQRFANEINFWSNFETSYPACL